MRLLKGGVEVQAKAFEAALKARTVGEFGASEIVRSMALSATSRIAFPFP